MEAGGRHEGADRPRARSIRFASRRSPRSLEEIAALPDPVGTVIAEWDRPNGLHIERVRTPLGVIGIIFESRPNVTADAGALALKAGNAVILRGGSDTLSQLCRDPSLPRRRPATKPACRRTAIQLVPTTRPRRGRRHAHAASNGAIDVIVPRGGQEPDRARAERGARAGLRASRRRLPRLRPRRRRS